MVRILSQPWGSTEERQRHLLSTLAGLDSRGISCPQETMRKRIETNRGTIPCAAAQLRRQPNCSWKILSSLLGGFIDLTHYCDEFFFGHAGCKVSPRKKGRRGAMFPWSFGSECTTTQRIRRQHRPRISSSECWRIKALSTQKTIVIHNNSEIPVDFSWRAFPSIQEEISQKLKLQVGRVMTSIDFCGLKLDGS